MRKLLLIAAAVCITAVHSYAQNFGPLIGLKQNVLAPNVNAAILDNYQSNSKDAVYIPSDSPDPATWDWNTYTELGWTEIEVSETDVISVVTIEYTWETHHLSFFGSFHLESPAGTEVIFASGDIEETFTVSMTDFFGESMDGTWILWIEDDYGLGGHQATDITITFHTQLSHDLGVISISPEFIASGESAHLDVELYNFGLNDQSVYEVNLTDGDIYDETINITDAFISNSNTFIEFPEYSNNDGIYNLTATVTLAGDENSSNDEYTGICYIGTGEYSTETVYAFDIWGNNTNNVLKIPIATGIVNPVMESNKFLAIGEYMNGMVYTFAHDGVYVILADGTPVKVANLSGTEPGDIYICGLAYDHINDVIYLSAGPPTDHGSLYTVDDSWNCTLVGTFQNDYIIGITTNATGDLFGLAIGNNSRLVSIDKSTAETTDIGPIGYNTNWVQDIGCDRNTNILYGTIYDPNTDIGRFGTFNSETGEFTNINANLGGHVVMCAVIPPPVSVEEITSYSVSVYPNPSNGVININPDYMNRYSTEITDINGKLILKKRNCKGQTQIDLSKHTKGVYIIKLIQDNQIRTGKIILK